MLRQAADPLVRESATRYSEARPPRRGFRRGTGVAGLALLVLWLSQFPVLRDGQPSIGPRQCHLAVHLSAIKTIAFTRIVLDLGADAAVMVFTARLLHLIRQARRSCEPSGNRRATETEGEGSRDCRPNPCPVKGAIMGAQQNDDRRCEGRRQGGSGQLRPNPCRSPPRWYRRLQPLAAPSCALVLAPVTAASSKSLDACGQPRRVALIAHDRQQYLVCLTGESSWLSNVRAAAGHGVICHRRTRQPVLAEELQARADGTHPAGLPQPRRPVHRVGLSRDREARIYVGVRPHPHPWTRWKPSPVTPRLQARPAPTLAVPHRGWCGWLGRLREHRNDPHPHRVANRS